MIEAADHDTIGDSAYRNIRNDIIFGQLRPSEKLRLEPLPANLTMAQSLADGAALVAIAGANGRGKSTVMDNLHPLC